MNSKEKKGLNELLSDLNVKDLVEIANLTTNHLSKYDTNAKPSLVVDDIIERAGSSSEILHRQKVSKDLLYNYLKGKGVEVKAKGRRQDYIRSCLVLWDSADQAKVQNEENARQTRSRGGAV